MPLSSSSSSQRERAMDFENFNRKKFESETQRN